MVRVPLDAQPPSPSPSSLSLSVCLLDAGSGAVLAADDADRVRPTASVGKVLLLIEVARRLVRADLDPAVPLTRTPQDAVANSGLWQHLRIDALAAPDLAALVGAVSDNLATNVLLRTAGLPAVTAIAGRLGLTRTRLHDRVRDVRGPSDPLTLSTGTAAELAGLMARLSRGEVIDARVLAQFDDAERDQALAAMHECGLRIRELVG